MVKVKLLFFQTNSSFNFPLKARFKPKPKYQNIEICECVMVFSPYRI